MTTTSQNGWPVLWSASQTRNWIIPGTHRTIRLQPGHAGFVLAHFALWYSESVQPIGVGTWDDWGWALGDTRGTAATESNHASGTAVDLNATQHPWGASVSSTYKVWQVLKIHLRLRWMRGVIRWGGDYQHSKIDSMHFEINAGSGPVNRLAKRLARTARGRRILNLNPGYTPIVDYRPGERDLKVGCSGPDVRFVQRKVGAKVDGHYGTQTASKVRAFERAHKTRYPHLKVDGVVGPITWRAMGIKAKY